MVITAIVADEEVTKFRNTLLKTPQFNLPHASTTSGRAVPIVHHESSRIELGAEIYGIDLNNFSDADFEFISNARQKHKLLLFKEQPQMLTPQQQYRLTSHFDLEKTTGGFAHGHDPFLTSHDGVNFFGIPKHPALLIQPQVHILGRGALPGGHFGFPPGFEVQGIDHEELHLSPHIPAEEREAVQIRKCLANIQERTLKPEYVMNPKVSEGDIIIWENYQMFHTAVDFPGDAVRTMHHANIGASSGSVGPVPIPTPA